MTQATLIGTTLAAVTLAGAALAGPAVTVVHRSTITVIKPDFTRPGGQPGAVREIAPAKPKATRRGRTPATQP